MPRGIYKRVKPVWNKGLTKKSDSRLIYFRPTAFEKGYTPIGKGKKAIWTTKRNLENNPGKIGKSHPKWKGSKVGYRALHSWVERQLGRPKFCEECGIRSLKIRQYHWANISKNYKRITADWRRLCVQCHKAFDK